MLSERPSEHRTTLRVLLVGEDTKERGEIRSVLKLLTEPEIEIDEGAPDGGARASADVAMVVLNGRDERALEFLQNEAQLPIHPIMLALLSDRSSNLMRRALRAGA